MKILKFVLLALILLIAVVTFSYEKIVASVLLPQYIDGVFQGSCRLSC